MITRKDFLKSILASSVAGALPHGAFANGALGVKGPLMIPYPAKPWAQATCIVGSRPRLNLADVKAGDYSAAMLPLYNDFCLVQDVSGRWHCIGILMEGSSFQDIRDDRLFHYVADSVQGPYRSIGVVDFGYGKSAHVWAPFIFADGHRSVMFYHYHRDASSKESSIRLAEAADPRLESWRRGDTSKEVLLSEPDARDPHVIRDLQSGVYLMYYVCSVRSPSDLEEVVRVRTSSNLLAWSEPRTVLGAPPGYKASESVFVLQENGYYYMWISGFDYSRMSLYISTDPFNFGNATTNRIEEQPGHASEIVQTGGRYWMACVGIATVTDLRDGAFDLNGVFIQPLEWKPATPEMSAKVVNSR